MYTRFTPRGRTVGRFLFKTIGVAIAVVVGLGVLRSWARANRDGPAGYSPPPQIAASPAAPVPDPPKRSRARVAAAPAETPKPKEVIIPIASSPPPPPPRPERTKRDDRGEANIRVDVPKIIEILTAPKETRPSGEHHSRDRDQPTRDRSTKGQPKQAERHPPETQKPAPANDRKSRESRR